MSSKSREPKGLKCVWCPNPRTRHDLCNRCRQKVESRVKRLFEQKVTGDSQIFYKLADFLTIDCNLMATGREMLSLLKKIGHFLVCVRYFLLQS